ncbi:MAG: GNAT family N-acetyltransferase [Clostridia bacterium]
MEKIDNILKISLRKYKPCDIDEIAELFYKTVHNVCVKDYSKTELNAWASGEIDKISWNKSFLEHDTIIADFNGKITGFADMDSAGYLDRLYVHKDFQNQGIGTEIVKKLEKTACELGVTKFTSYASITAKPFFEKMGYVVVCKNIVVRNDVKLTNYKMEKLLNNI